MARSVCGERQANASSRLTRASVGCSQQCQPLELAVTAALTGAPLRPCHAVTLYGDQQGSLRSIERPPWASPATISRRPRRVRRGLNLRYGGRLVMAAGDWLGTLAYADE